ncbi:MAG: MupA/Atu3671 family FMN-dependent luciferase-like monooxygenase [Blastocatellia bacterium]
MKVEGVEEISREEWKGEKQRGGDAGIERKVEGGNLFYIIYTSGSTGRPKGVAVEHRGVTNITKWFCELYDSKPGDRGIQLASPSFDAMTIEIWPLLCSGGTICFVDDETRASSSRLLKHLKDNLIDVCWVPITMAEAIMDEPLPEKLPLRLMSTGGDRLLRRPRLPFRFANVYGPTEASVVTTYADFDVANETGEPPSIGVPIANMQTYVLDRWLQPLPVGIPGELYIGGVGLARGYVASPDLTAARFIPNPLSETGGERLYRTGDIVKYLHDGRIDFLGRADIQIKLRGFRIEPGEIEQVLSAHSAVRSAAVLAKEGPGGNKMLVAFVESSQDDLSLSDQLRAFLKERLPEYMIPAVFVRLDSIPKNQSGKKDRKALSNYAVDFVTEEQTIADAQSPVEDLVTGLLARTFRIETVTRHDNFFELGGHSLLATRIVSKLNGIFKVNLPLRSIFENPTASGLSAAIRAEMNAQRELEVPPLCRSQRDEQIPISFSQQRLWFLAQLQPDSPFYNLPMAVRIQGRINLVALDQCLNEIIRRHEILRTTFSDAPGHPVQIVSLKSDLELQMIDLRALDQSELQENIARLCREEAKESFDLRAGPLLRAKILRLGEQEYIFLLTMHHIISDGWSMGVFIGEVEALYRALSGGKSSPLIELPLQYGDYSIWQRRLLQNDVLERQLRNWKHRLADKELILELPTDRPRPPVQTLRGARKSIVLPATLTGSLKALSRQKNATLFMTLMAALKVFLHRYTAQNHVIVGTPIAGRSQPEIEGLIGFFLNMLALNTDLSDDPTFNGLLDRVRETTLNAFADQDLPFEHLVEAVQTRRDLSRSPVFQVMFTLQNMPKVTMKLDGLELTHMEIDPGIARYDLSFSLSEVGECLTVILEYNSDLFDQSTAARMLSQYGMILEGVVKSPRLNISQIPLLNYAERNQILFEWNDTQIDCLREATIHQLFESQVERAPDRIAVVFDNEQVTYGRLNAMANQVAHYLQSLNVGVEDRVAVSIARSSEMVVALIGVLKVGAAYVPLDPAYPKERLSFMLKDADVSALVAKQSLSATLPEEKPFMIWLDKDRVRIGGSSQQNPNVPVSGGNAAYVIYTSGSTGTPKGVIVTHENVLNFFAGMDSVIGCETPGTWLAVTSISFDISVLELFWTLARGFKIVIQREQFKAEAEAEPYNEMANRPMDFGLFYFESNDSGGNEDKYRLLFDGAKYADAHGFSAVWTPERHFHAFGGLFPNPSVVSAAVAAITTRIQIRAGSVVLPLHNPVRVAEEWSVVDNISRGRVAISFASGWHANDFSLAPDNYINRKQVMLEGIETVRRLWRGEPVKLRDGAGSEVELKIYPRPVQPELPTWITAAGNPETFTIAGQAGSNVLTHLLGQSLDDLEEKIAMYRQALSENGYEPKQGRVTLMLHAFIGDDIEVVREQVRAPLCRYLKSSVDLLRSFARSLNQDVDPTRLSEEEVDALIARSFDRYFETSGLFGTVETSLRLINRLKAIGVDEVACLIDFGLSYDEALSGLHYLNILRERSNQRQEREMDHSIAAQIRRQNVTHLQCTPSLARMLISDAESREVLPTVQKIMIGGESLAPSVVLKYREVTDSKIINLYGPTETTIWSTTQIVEEVEETVSIGRPIANTQIYILDKQLQPTPPGVPGHMHIGGAGVVRGYHQRADIAAERFIPDFLSGAQGGRLYCTGDLASYRPDGRIEFLGRIDRQMKISGHRIEPGEIEATLEKHPSVKNAVVIAREGEAGDNRLICYVVGARSEAVPADISGSPGAQQYHRMPNGLIVAGLGSFQTSIAYREIFENQIYFRHGITLKPGDCVFDVGANMGLFSLFVNQTWPGVEIYAFEPIPKTFQVLQTNAALHGLRAKLFDCGLADKTGQADFIFYPEMSGLSGRYSNTEEARNLLRSIISGRLRNGQTDQQNNPASEDEIEALLGQQFKSEVYTCQLRTLSDIIRDNNVEQIDLLKVDVEKSELDVLRGIRDEHWPIIRQVVMEIDTPELLEGISRILERQGFEFVSDRIALTTSSDTNSDAHVYMLYGVKTGAANALSSERGEKIYTASFEPERLSASDLRNFLKDRLPAHMTPSEFVFLDALPLTPNGKINVKALPDPNEARREEATSHVAPKSDVEKMIASIWQELLRHDGIGLHDNFFEAGGTSLLLVEARNRLERAFKRQIPIIELLKHPTIFAFSGYIGQQEVGKLSAEKILDRADRRSEALSRQRKMGRPAQSARMKSTDTQDK